MPDNARVGLLNPNRLYQAVLSPVTTHTIGTNECVHGQQVVSAQPIVLPEHFQAKVKYCRVQLITAQYNLLELKTAYQSPVESGMVQPCMPTSNAAHCSPACWENRVKSKVKYCTAQHSQLELKTAYQSPVDSLQYYIMNGTFLNSKQCIHSRVYPYFTSNTEKATYAGQIRLDQARVGCFWLQQAVLGCNRQFRLYKAVLYFGLDIFMYNYWQCTHNLWPVYTVVSPNSACSYMAEYSLIEPI